jgi:pullulanase
MAVMLLFLTVFSAFSDVTPVRADGELKLKLHYHREDGAYDEWSVWMWGEGLEGNDYALEDEDGDKVATMDVPAGTTSVGFIVRTQDWAKDVDEDQFIDISEMVSGTVDVYVESGVEGYTKEYGADAVTGTKLKSAVYNGDGTITATMTGEIDGDANKAFTLRDKSNSITISSVDGGSDFIYTLTLADELDNTKSYFITFDGSEMSVQMPIIYSTDEFEAEYTYDGDDLGATWTKDSTAFRVWAPTAEEVYVNLYESGTSSADDLIEQIPMTADVNGTWVATKDGDLNGTYYTYTAVLDGLKQEVCDPYARTTGVNGKRAMVIDLDSTDPDGWDKDTNPHAGESINDAIIYELQMRDLSADESSGIENVGKFLSLTETGTTTEGGVSTGLDHLKDLGITHLHLMPIYDFGSVNETYTQENLYNWGYDPVNYNVPEGSYSTDPYNGEVRVSEMKQMVKSLHDSDISVVMDVVYNHVYSADDFCINRLVPGYFSRISEDGTYSNGSGCGNDTASERSMVKKYIVDSVKYWVDEYHIDGFRFDLVGLLDTETVNEIVEEVHKDHPDVIFYGEGWTLNTTLTKDGYTLATQQSSEKTPDFAYFNDTIRDALKGGVFNEDETGYVSGSINKEDIITRCFMGNDSWCSSPSQTINYASCHDNMTLFDRLSNSRPDADTEDLIRMNNLAAAIYMTSEGVPFMMSGEEMLRSKPNGDGTYNSNSYNAGDEVNALKWSDLEDEQYQNVYNYYKGLIAFRKAHGALRLSDAADVEENVKPVEGMADNVVAFDINGGVNGETAKEIYVIFNANTEEQSVELPDGDWNVYIDGEKAGTEVLSTIKDGTAVVAPISAMVLVRESAGLPAWAIGIIVLVALAAIVVVICVLDKKKKAKAQA